MRRKLIKVTAIAAIALLALLLCACSGQSLEPGEATATVSGEEITVSAAFTEQLQNARKDMTVYLFAVAPDVSVNTLLSSDPEPLAEAKMAANISFTVPLCENGESNLTTGYIMATYDKLQKVYKPLYDAPVYISNPEALAQNKESLPERNSIKGATADSASQAISLGVSHALVELPIEEYLNPISGSDTVRHEFRGVSYYFDRAAVEELDKKIAALTEADIEVYLRIYLGQNYEDLPDEQKYLSYPDTVDGKRYYPINFGEGEAMLSYSAFVDLLCSRYAQNDPDFGQAHSVIFGKAANSADLGTEQEELTGGVFAGEYAVALRITHNILRSYCEHGQVYLSIDDNIYAPDATGFIDGEEFLTSVAAIAKDQGDYEWGVAAECASSFAGNDALWNDTETSSTVTPTNFSSLTDVLLERDELTYGDVVRPVIISDFSIYSDPEKPASEENQAVSYAYTYYEAARNGKIKALIYSVLEDTEYSTEGLISAKGEKEICEMMRKIDTDFDISDIVGNHIGSAWTKLYGNDDLKNTVQRGKYADGDASLGKAENYELSPLISFDDGTLSGFYTVGDGQVGLVRRNGSSQLAAHFDPTLTPDGDFAVAVNGVSPDLISGNYLVMPLSIQPDGDLAVDDYKLTLTLLQNEPNGEIRIYSSSLTVSPGEDKTAIFDISEFSGNKLGSDVTVLIAVEGSESTAFTLCIGELLSGTEPSNNWIVILIVVLIILVVAALIVVFVIWFRKNYTIDFGGKKKAKGQKKAKKEPKEEE